MADCIFCKLVANEISSYTLYEDSETRAFLDVMPSVEGHAMVILKKHGETIFDYTARELGVLMESVKTVAHAIQKTYNTSVLSIGTNHGEPNGVHHLHIHIIPRFKHDGGKVLQSLVTSGFNGDFKEVAKKIKKNRK